MDRLTEKRDGRYVIPLRQGGKCRWDIHEIAIGDPDTLFLYGDHADRLAAYENTGVEPKDVSSGASSSHDKAFLDSVGIRLDFQPKCTGCVEMDLEIETSTLYADDKAYATFRVLKCGKRMVCDRLESMLNENRKEQEQ